MTYPRGSEWRRWDLHIHTPETNKEDQYSGATPQEKWDKFYETINNYIGDGEDISKRVVAIGITDYLSIDNYLKVISDKRISDKIELILPNVEMRITPIAQKTPVNIHFIFNPDIVEQLENRFFNKLKFPYKGRDFLANRTDLIQLGYAFNPSIKSDEEAYKSGVQQYVVNINTILDIFNTDRELRDNTIIAVSNNSKDGASGITEHSAFFEGSTISQLEATRRQIYQLSDLIFSAQDSDRDYFLGKKADSPEQVICKCGSLKGCIHGCDAHCNDKVFEPDKKRYCWIKADPTFNGLKQVIYEPETRVRISSVFPEEKNDYQVIDKVQIDDENVQTEPICFNDKLTCIIGGKSTGKSLLLHNVAFSIDEKQVREKSELTGVNIEGRKLQSVCVFWKDGIKTGDEEAEGRKIVYIPQTYLNRLSDRHEELTEIDKIIKDVVLISPEAKYALETMQNGLISQKSRVDQLIYETINQFDVIQTKKNQLSEIGTKVGIEKELEKLNAQKEKLAKSSSISEDDIAKYNDAFAKEKSNSLLIDKLRSDIDALQKQTSVVERTVILYRYEETVADQLNVAIDNVLEISNRTWEKEKGKLIDSIDKRIADLIEENTNLKLIIDKLKPNITGNEAIKIISESIQKEQEKLGKVINLEKDIESLNRKLDENIDKLIEAFFGYSRIRKEYETSISAITDLSRDGLDFSVNTPIRMEAFRVSLRELLDARSLKNHKDIIDLEEATSDWMNSDNLNKLIKTCLDGTIKIKGSKSPEQALREILSDWNNTTYQVKMDDDDINEMSPGKKAIVLLKLLINLAESTCPILIDQPEDDLDNRSVFEELIPFIKEKKIQRQIIVVTHNANVVLGGDSEEIIVANQAGINTPNDSKRIEYRSGAIEENRAIDDKNGVLYSRGIQQHICDILEGGEKAFDLRRNKYRIS